MPLGDKIREKRLVKMLIHILVCSMSIDFAQCDEVSDLNLCTSKHTYSELRHSLYIDPMFPLVDWVTSSPSLDLSVTDAPDAQHKRRRQMKPLQNVQCVSS